MYLCVSDIDFPSFYCYRLHLATVSNGVVILVFHFIAITCSFLRHKTVSLSYGSFLYDVMSLTLKTVHDLKYRL